MLKMCWVFKAFLKGSRGPQARRDGFHLSEPDRLGGGRGAEAARGSPVLCGGISIEPNRLTEQNTTETKSTDSSTSLANP